MQAIQHKFGDLAIESINIGKGELPSESKPQGGIKRDRRVDLIIYYTPVVIDLNDFDFKKLKQGDRYIIDNLNFHGGRHILLSKSIPTLRKLCLLMQEHLSLSIDVHGHICCANGAPEGMDADTSEMLLSHNRAKNIFEYLVRKGIDSTRIQYRGFGHSRPLILPEKTPEDRMQNRRVEIRITAH